MMRLVQLQRGEERRVGVVEEPRIQLTAFASVYALCMAAGFGAQSIQSLVEGAKKAEGLDYEAIYAGTSEWKLLTPIDHPTEPARCLISGTGLTHLGSAKNRDAMHEKQKKNIGGDADATPETDSMKMFRWGVEGGKPAAGKIGIAPEWFYKGTGANLRGHDQTLEIPTHAEDGGEEGEIAGIYIIDGKGQPVRVGMAIGNEFSDHVFEKRNYLNLAGSKLRQCAIGPELVIGADFGSVPGKVTITREGRMLWTKEICSGEQEMCHSLANIEHHHFKFEGHRRPGDVHVHFFGACAPSFGDGVTLVDGDVMQVEFAGFGRGLRNVLRKAAKRDELVRVEGIR